MFPLRLLIKEMPGCRGKVESIPPSAVATEELLETIFLGLALVEGVLAGGWPGVVCTMGTLLRVEALNQKKRCLVFISQRCTGSIEGCCICRAKSCSSQFKDSKRYEKEFQSCFGLHETRSGDICNACVLLLKRWKKLPAGSKQNKKENNNNNKTNKQTKPLESCSRCKSRPQSKDNIETKESENSIWKQDENNQISKLQKEFKCHNSDAHSTTSSVSPVQSLCYSNQFDEGSDTETASSSSRTPVFSFLDLTYWKRQKICCGIIYKGLFGEVLIDTHLFRPC